MWHTSCGRRTLQGAEATVLAAALEALLRQVVETRGEMPGLGPKCFDDLTYGQKITALLIVARGLLQEEIPIVELTADLEGAIAAGFDSLESMVTCEIEDNSVQEIRKLIVAARREMAGEEIPNLASTDLAAWQRQIEQLQAAI